MSEATEPTTVQTAFFVVVDDNGAIEVFTDKIPSVTVRREATLVDIEAYLSQLLRDVGRVLTAQAMSLTLRPPTEPTTADRVTDALKKRETE